MALETDDLEPLVPKPHPRDLETMSIDELEAYISEMEAEIDRVREVIASKQGHRSSAEDFFKR